MPQWSWFQTGQKSVRRVGERKRRHCTLRRWKEASRCRLRRWQRRRGLARPLIWERPDFASWQQREARRKRFSSAPKQTFLNLSESFSWSFAHQNPVGLQIIRLLAKNNHFLYYFFSEKENSMPGFSRQKSNLFSLFQLSFFWIIQEKMLDLEEVLWVSQNLEEYSRIRGDWRRDLKHCYHKKGEKRVGTACIVHLLCFTVQEEKKKHAFLKG